MGEGPQGAQRPQSPALSQTLVASPSAGRAPASPHPPGGLTDSSLSLGREFGALARAGWLVDADLEVGLESSVSQVAGQSRKESGVSRVGPLGASGLGSQGQSRSQGARAPNTTSAALAQERPVTLWVQRLRETCHTLSLRNSAAEPGLQPRTLAPTADQRLGPGASPRL